MVVPAGRLPSVTGVAAKLDVSVKTVETHKLRAMEKLGFHSRVDAVQYAHRQGWFDEA